MKTKQTYNHYQLACAVLMALALLWLTVSAPFVFSHQQKIAKQGKIAGTCKPVAGNDEEVVNPFGNNEEKVLDSSSFSEEYLHNHDKSDPFFTNCCRFRDYVKADTYIAFHGEILVPPPNQA